MDFYTKGRQDAAVQVTVTLHHKSLIASAEDEHLSENQFVKAVQNMYPDYEVVTLGGRDGFWYARGGKVK
ncbi:MAG TPA: hypothetical protein VM537_19710 [Anaerolineae bacterium]|nr:hypothetical protein [Anaerolineae bacterium]